MRKERYQLRKSAESWGNWHILIEHPNSTDQWETDLVEIKELAYI